MLISDRADNLTIDNATVEAWLERHKPHILPWWREHMAKPPACHRCQSEVVVVARDQWRPDVRPNGPVDVCRCGECGNEWYGWNPPGQELASQRLARQIRLMAWLDWTP